MSNMVELEPSEKLLGRRLYKSYYGLPCGIWSLYPLKGSWHATSRMSGKGCKEESNTLFTNWGDIPKPQTTLRQSLHNPVLGE